MTLENVNKLINTKRNKQLLVTVGLIAFGLMLSAMYATDDQKAFAGANGFHLEEATIADIHNGIQAGDITCEGLVQLYIDRAAAYNGVCTQLVTAAGTPIPPATGYVRAGSPIVFPTDTILASSILPDLGDYVGLPLDLGKMEPSISDPSVQLQFGMRLGIPDAGQVNALETINIRGERSVTCRDECDAAPGPGMKKLPKTCPAVCNDFRQLPDALERAAELDAEFGSNPDLDSLPLYCIPFGFKDWYDTKDMRSTGGQDVNFAMDVPQVDSPLVAEIRAKGAIIYATTQAGIAGWLAGGTGDSPATPLFQGRNLFSGPHSTWGGTPCNPYDTEREPGNTSGGSGAAVSANLVVCAICEQTSGSCRNPGSHSGVVSLLGTKGLNPNGGSAVQFIQADRGGILCRTLADATIVLDEIKGYESRDIYTSIPQAFISEEPYASFVIDDPEGKPLAGMRIGIVSEHMVKPTVNDEAIVDKIIDDIKTVLRDQLGAELVESFDPDYPNVFTGIKDDKKIPNMEYSFQRGIEEGLARHSPEIFFQESGGNLRFDVAGFDVTTLDYMVAVARDEAPLSDDLNIRQLVRNLGSTRAGHFTNAVYLADRGDTTVNDWESFVANAKWFSDRRRVTAETSVGLQDIRSDGKDARMKMDVVLNLIVNRVMLENDIDAFVQVRTTLPPNRIGGPNEPSISAGRAGSITDRANLPEIIIPGGFNDIVYEALYALNDDKDEYIRVSGTVQSVVDNPAPMGMMFWGAKGTEPVLIKIASAYEAASQHRIPPPDFPPRLQTNSSTKSKKAIPPSCS